MAQDLRRLFKERRDKEKPSMLEGHENRFLTLLGKELPSKKKVRFSFLKIAVSALILVGLGLFTYQGMTEEKVIEPEVVEESINTKEQKNISLGDLSPDFKKVETYYVTHINLELSKLEISNENRALIDSFMEQLDILNTEYRYLNEELNDIGPNDQTISALVQNLQLRLQLLQKLKKKLNELKISKNEQVKTSIL